MVNNKRQNLGSIAETRVSSKENKVIGKARLSVFLELASGKSIDQPSTCFNDKEGGKHDSTVYDYKAALSSPHSVTSINQRKFFLEEE